MKVKDMTDYLANFGPDEDLPIVVLDPKARIWHQVENVVTIEENPFIGIEVHGSEPFDEDLTRAAEEDERDAESQEAGPPS